MIDKRINEKGTSPTLIRLLVEHGDRLDQALLSTLRAIMCTGSGLSDATRKAFANRYGVPLYNYYGLTETTGLCAANAAIDGEGPPGSLGKLQRDLLAERFGLDEK